MDLLDSTQSIYHSQEESRKAIHWGANSESFCQTAEKKLSIPYFFNVTDIQAGNILRVWTLNGKKIEGRGSESAITFRQPDEAGSSQISVSVANGAKVLQSAQTNMLLRFNKTNTQ